MSSTDFLDLGIPIDFHKFFVFVTMVFAEIYSLVSPFPIRLILNYPVCL